MPNVVECSRCHERGTFWLYPFTHPHHDKFELCRGCAGALERFLDGAELVPEPAAQDGCALPDPDGGAPFATAVYQGGPLGAVPLVTVERAMGAPTPQLQQALRVLTGEVLRREIAEP